MQCFRSIAKRGSVAVVLMKLLKTCVPRVDVGTEHGAMITLKWSLISSRLFLFPSMSPSLAVPSLLARARSPHVYMIHHECFYVMFGIMNVLVVDC